MQPLQEQTAGLENKLRGMILSNTGSGDGLGPSPHIVPSADPRSGLGAPPNARSFDVPPGLDRQPPSLTPGEGIGAQKSLKPTRKRPNQAQRRQMSAQLSIPIDPRPQMSHQSQQHMGTSYHYQHRQSPGFSPNDHQHQLSNGHPFEQRQNSHPHGQPGGHGALYGAASPPNYTQMRSQYSPPYDRFAATGEYSQWRGQRGGHNGEQHPRSYQMPSFGGDRPSQEHGYQGRNRPGNSGFGRLYQFKPDDVASQAELLNGLCDTIIRGAEISYDEIAKNEGFRATIEHICRIAISEFEANDNGNTQFSPLSVQLRCFGSLSSGFATKASDMDLGLLSPLSHPLPDDAGSPIPRLIEKAFLEAGLGARLLTRTRVPIIKLCEKPPEKLRMALLEERGRWERGEDEDPALEDDETNEEGRDDGVAQSPADAGTDGGEAGGDQKPKAIEVGTEAYERALAQLKQTGNSTLTAYYGLAKRLLRRLGGSDITNSNMRNLGKQDLQIVTDVAHAFVRGLADAELVRRLQATVSVSLRDDANYPTTRTLAGMHTQVEGEALAMAWEKRQIQEKDAIMEKEAASKLKFWTELQNRAMFGLDPLGFAKELKQAVDTLLKRIPSIQMHILKQGQYESPSEYHGRTSALLSQLGAHDTPSPTNMVLPLAIAQYVTGIWDKDIREQVIAFAEEEGVDTLRAAARRHRSLQLALEFQRALKKGLYEDDRDVVADYMAILRRRMQRLDSSHRHFDFVVPITQEDTAVMRKIKSLPHPSMTAPNQPRDPYHDRLEFPPTGAGVQCDINFSAHLALQNTLLLRCYSHTDPRVRPLVLFVKHWAKVRGINTAYRGTLSSYGYVLMMLHYLVNIAQPFVCPNLQQLAKPTNPHLTPAEKEATENCKGRDVRFWRDEEEIKRLAAEGRLNQNQESIGHLLRGFFEYYAQSGTMSTSAYRGFDWGREVISLRTSGGLRMKQDKGWTGAKTTIERQPKTPSAVPAVLATSEPSPPLPGTPQAQRQSTDALASPPPTAVTPRPFSEVKEVRHRYLFAIEDPFELEHNVARTVTHNGIVSIRDEFRRAWRIIKSAGKASPTGTSLTEELLQSVVDADRSREKNALVDLLDEIHGRNIPF
ncbi:hypothetical protein RB597_002835 [Gaeumannomyces tritici]